MPSINSARVLFLATDGYERSELRVPLENCSSTATATIASLKSDPIKSWDEKNWGDTLDVDILVQEARSRISMRWSFLAARSIPTCCATIPAR